MRSSDTDTLAFQMTARPGIVHRDMSWVPLKSVGVKCAEYKNGSGLASPEADAITFYLGFHIVSEVARLIEDNEPLGDVLPLVDTYHDNLNQCAMRLFYYIFMITHRESRHLHAPASKITWLKGKHGSACTDFTASLHTGPTQAVAQLIENPPDITIGEYVAYLHDVFFECSWSASYGGAKWGKVTDCLHSFVTGEYSAEMMLDVGYTLAHNGGPIFDKGIVYSGCKKQELIRLLDVQRGGMIPGLVANDESGFVTMQHMKYLKDAIEVLPQADFPTYVDWFVVEALGAVNSYPSDKNKQKANFGASEGMKKAEEIKKKKSAALLAKKAQESKKWVEIMPGVKVKKVSVSR